MSAMLASAPTYISKSTAAAPRGSKRAKRVTSGLSDIDFNGYAAICKTRKESHLSLHTVVQPLLTPRMFLAPRSQGDPKMRVAIVGSGLAGLSTAVELLDQGCVALWVCLSYVDKTHSLLFLAKYC